MCPKFKNGVCEVVNLEPEHVECADINCCYKSDDYEIYKLYMVDRILDWMTVKALLNNSLKAAA